MACDTAKPKRKRGRPKGSKNKPKGPQAGGASLTDLDAGLRAPNGMPGTGPDDYLQELLPLLAREEMRQMQEETEEEKSIRQMIADISVEVSQRADDSKRLDNLRPFARREKRKTCSTCRGNGMVTCSYCKGEGFVDFGPNGEKFFKEFGGTDMVMPKCVTGNIYHCPYCGGLTEERCEECFGMGECADSDKEKYGKEMLGDKDEEEDDDEDELLLEEEEDGDGDGEDDAEHLKRLFGAAREDYRDAIWNTNETDLSDLRKHEEGEIQVGEDGLVIVRAKSRKGTGGRKRKVKRDVVKDADDTEKKEEEAKKPKRRRGRPRKSTVVADEPSPSPKVQVVMGKKKVGKTTDFVNTTDYQVGRKLRSKGGRKKKMSAPDDNGGKDI